MTSIKLTYISSVDLREHLILKKVFSFGHCPNEGGGRALPELKNTLYIFLYDGRKRCTSCPKEGEGGEGEVIRAMPERKHLFLYEVFPNTYNCMGARTGSLQRIKEDSSLKSSSLTTLATGSCSVKRELTNDTNVM